MNNAKNILFTVLLLMLGACSPKIYGTVQLLDANLKPIPPAQEGPQGTVVNMINTTTTLEKASQAVVVDADGKFVSVKDYIIPGVYKVEASRIGFMTETQSVEVTKFRGKKVEFKLKKIPEGKRKSIEGSKSDEDKIVNPGEVNMQPPAM
ncbi:MAG TPA: carboxypeptidase-like regulatory domain-containing protein [Nitrospirota bacterium]|nr:carboxypeptidase-like regulatory domain-containing protein [Nitrospirota bacterium]